MGDWPILSTSRAVDDDLTFNPYTTSLATPSGANTKGAWTTIIASTPFDAVGLLIEVQMQGATPFLFDIGIGAASSEVVVFPNMSMAATGGTHSMGHVFVPLSIPKGTRVAMRYQTSGINYFKVKAQLVGTSFADMQAPSTWYGWGPNTANSQGTQVVGGSANTKGSFVQLVAAADETTRWLMVALVSGSVDDCAVDIAFGTTVVIPNIYTTNESFGTRILLPFSVPKGTQVQARVATGGAGNNCNVSVYGGA